jgi:predicted AlkP superfamily pyrophosphatase or phosphodiesterase
MNIFSNPFINWRRVRLYGIMAVLVWSLSIFLLIQENKPAHKRVVLLVIDGLRSDALVTLGPQSAPNFHFLMRTGASTLNARTDLRSSLTLPNMISILTGRPVFDGTQAHKYLSNEYTGYATHDYKDVYIESIFDVLHENNMRAAFFSAKDKMGVFIKSYTDEKYVGPSKRGSKDPARIQSYFIADKNDGATLDKFLIDLNNFDSRFIFLHLAGPDRAGHQSGWSVEEGSAYMAAVQRVDSQIGEIIEAVQKRRHLRENVYLIITSDHGGDGEDHFNIYNKYNYTVPFIVWGPGVAKGADLYELNSDTRRDPKEGMVVFESDKQPVRNSDAGNLALSLLELPSIPNSVINALQSLRVHP